MTEWRQQTAAYQSAYSWLDPAGVKDKDADPSGWVPPIPYKDEFSAEAKSGRFGANLQHP